MIFPPLFLADEMRFERVKWIESGDFIDLDMINVAPNVFNACLCYIEMIINFIYRVLDIQF